MTPACSWVPVRERSRSIALVYSGMYLGSILGLGLSPYFIQKAGWPSVFYGYGSLGVFWYLWWERSWASAPAEDGRISQREARFIARTAAQQVGARSRRATRASSWLWLCSRKLFALLCVGKAPPRGPKAAPGAWRFCLQQGSLHPTNEKKKNKWKRCAPVVLPCAAAEARQAADPLAAAAVAAARLGPHRHPLCARLGG